MSILDRTPLSFAVICLSLALAMAGATRAAGTDSTPSATTTNDPGPQQLVEDSAQRLLAELDANRAIYAKDPAKLDALVATVLLPKFDTQYAARLVLGFSWRTATPDQRRRFVDAFYHSLLRNYGEALLNFTADRFEILPFRGDPGSSMATVRTEVTKSSGEKVPVDFTLHRTASGWKAWDIVIDGISYVKSFRTDFAEEIEAKGLNELINRLEKQSTVPASPS